MFNDAILMRAAVAAAASSQFNSNLHNFMAFNNGSHASNQTIDPQHISIKSENPNMASPSASSNKSNVLPFFLPIQS